MSVIGDKSSLQCALHLSERVASLECCACACAIHPAMCIGPSPSSPAAGRCAATDCNCSPPAAASDASVPLQQPHPRRQCARMERGSMEAACTTSHSSGCWSAVSGRCWAVHALGLTCSSGDSSLRGHSGGRTGSSNGTGSSSSAQRRSQRIALVATSGRCRRPHAAGRRAMTAKEKSNDISTKKEGKGTGSKTSTQRAKKSFVR